MVLAAARCNSVTSRSWKVSSIRSTPLLDCGDRACILLYGQLPHHPSEANGVDRYRLLTFAADNQNDASLLDYTPEHQVASDFLAGA